MTNGCKTVCQCATESVVSLLFKPPGLGTSSSGGKTTGVVTMTLKNQYLSGLVGQEVSGLKVELDKDYRL